MLKSPNELIERRRFEQGAEKSRFFAFIFNFLDMHLFLPESTSG
jgi:hypothetical protein